MSIGKPDKRKTFLASLCALAGGLSLWSAPALATCPNEAVRTGLSASLPDCRAYEMVSPLDKNGHGVYGGSSEVVHGQAAVGGGAVAYIANGAFPGSVSGTDGPGEYLAVRGVDGWSNESLFPPQAFSYGATILTPAFPAFSSDLSKAVLGDATDSPPLVAGEQETGGVAKASNLFVRDNTTGTYSLVNFPAPGLAFAPAPYRPTFDGASADFSTVIFNAPAALTPEAPGGSGGSVQNLYEWSGGVVSLVSQIPPAGASSCGPAGPACIPAPNGGRFGGENAVKNEFAKKGSFVRIISSDGSRVFFTANNNGDLYVRESGETTVQVDAPQGGAGPGGGGLWQTAASDGSRVFFYDDASAGLTSDSAPGSGTNLYGYDTATGTLTDLTPAAKAEVLGVVNEASQDGSYLYFIANGVLTSTPNSLGQIASPGDCHLAQQETCNLYLSHDGAISFIHTLSGAAAENAYKRLSMLTEHTSSRVTPDGRHIAFFAEGSSSGGGNSGRATFDELFEYSADSGAVSHLCACGASEFRGLSGNVLGLEQETSTFQYTRGLSDDGSRLFFESYQALLPGDTNGQPDVYEFEHGGAGAANWPPVACIWSPAAPARRARGSSTPAPAAMTSSSRPISSSPPPTPTALSTSMTPASKGVSPHHLHHRPVWAMAV